jgi:hypothetical protein
VGVFDYAICKGPEFVCSEGHDLTGQEFQTKDFACVLAYVTIEDGHVTTEEEGPAGAMTQPPFDSPFTVYTSCERCPVFVQARTGNLCDVCCEFEIAVEGDRILSIKRISETTAEFLTREPSEPWMKDCEGPMPRSESWARRMAIWDARKALTHPGDRRRGA